MSLLPSETPLYLGPEGVLPLIQAGSGPTLPLPEPGDASEYPSYPRMRVSRSLAFLGSRVRGNDESEVSRCTSGWEEALATLEQWLAQHRDCRRLRLYLAAEFAPLWRLPGATARLSEIEQRGWVSDQARRSFGDASQRWRIAHRPAPAGESLLVSHLEQPRWDALQHVLNAAGVRLTALLPWAAEALARQPAGLTARLAVQEGERTTLISLKHGEPCAIASSRGEEIGVLLARAALTDGLGDAPERRIPLSDPATHGRRRPWTGQAAPDFLAPPVRPGAAGWGLLAAGAALALFTFQRHAELTAATTPDPLPRASMAVIAPAPPKPALTHPWKVLMPTLERLQPKNVALLRLHADAASGEARLTAQTRRTEAMLDWLRALAAAPGFTRVTLLRHEAIEGNGAAVEFELSLLWQRP